MRKRNFDFTFYFRTSHQSKVGSFKSIEGFWSFWNNLVPPSRLPIEATYYVFQSHIQPAWEDKNNQDGGEIRMFFNKVSPQVVDNAWTNLLLAVVGETLSDSNFLVCGLTVSRKKHKSKISVWINKCDNESRNGLETGIRNALGTDFVSRIGLQLDWTNHQHLLEKEHRKESSGGLQFNNNRSLQNNRRNSGNQNLRVARPPSIGDNLAN